MPKKSRPPSRSQTSPEPEIQPPGVFPKKSPNPPQPLDDDGLEAAKRDTTPSSRNESGPDPIVESGIPDHDPEQPRETDEEKSME
ncbi:MAG: hypothetical protein JWQ62_2468 [Lacunisphaera sp.]|nr:hypothetical protein [Lacunisphaera sp.]